MVEIDDDCHGLMSRPHGEGYPGGSRDYWNISLSCAATGCVANSGFGTCAVPALAIIGANGKCRGFSTGKKKK
jgi:hypothetical protein